MARATLCCLPASGKKRAVFRAPKHDPFLDGVRVMTRREVAVPTKAEPVARSFFTETSVRDLPKKIAKGLLWMEAERIVAGQQSPL